MICGVICCKIFLIWLQAGFSMCRWSPWFGILWLRIRECESILRVLDLTDICILQTACFVFQWTLKLTPTCFNNTFKYVTSIHSFNTRQSSNKNLSLSTVTTTQYGLRSLHFIGSKIWNSLPLNIRNTSSLSSFKNLLSNHLLDKYTYFNWLIIIRSVCIPYL